ncbi:MAG: glutamate--tRNA ligase [Phycisphaerae bacterium]|jgi:glutamyl-tRNA synthetase
MDKLRTRFAPSPTGYPHVGNIRTALYDYLLARKSGGTFVVRIEDTDRDRHNESAIAMIVEDLRWLGLEWDEGIEVGGPHEPYRQSLRLERYAQCIRRLLEEGKAYHAFDTEAELDALREKAMAEKRTFRYDRPASLPTAADVERARAEGRPVVVRFLCPARDLTIHDEVFGDVTMPAAEMEDFIIQKADGYPTFYLANAADDADMEINFVTRGQEFLGQTWRQVFLREALGFPEPRYAHLPMIMDMKGRKLSKRDGDVDVHSFRKAGYLPEVMVNFIALLGWNPGGDRERMSLAEMVELFSVDRIGKSNAKFDRDKLLAFNTDALAAAGEERLLAGLKDYLSLNETPIPAHDEDMLRRLLKANHGMRTFADIPFKCNVLFAPDDAFAYDEAVVAKVLTKNDGEGLKALAAVRELLAGCPWQADKLEEMIKDFCQSRTLGMGKVAQPLRVAVTGTTISPSIYDTLLILGKERSLARIDRCLSTFRPCPG